MWNFECGQVFVIECDDFVFGEFLMIVFQGNECIGCFFLFFVGLCYYCCFQYCWVVVEYVFQFDGGDVFVVGDDDVFELVVDFDVVVWMVDCQVVGMELVVGEGFFGGVGIFQVVFYYGIVVYEYFVDGLVVVWYWFEGFWVGYYYFFEGWVVYVLV